MKFPPLKPGPGTKSPNKKWAEGQWRCSPPRPHVRESCYSSHVVAPHPHAVPSSPAMRRHSSDWSLVPWRRVKKPWGFIDPATHVFRLDVICTKKNSCMFLWFKQGNLQKSTGWQKKQQETTKIKSNDPWKILLSIILYFFTFLIFFGLFGGPSKTEKIWATSPRHPNFGDQTMFSANNCKQTIIFGISLWDKVNQVVVYHLLSQVH